MKIIPEIDFIPLIDLSIPLGNPVKMDNKILHIQEIKHDHICKHLCSNSISYCKKEAISKVEAACENLSTNDLKETFHYLLNLN